MPRDMLERPYGILIASGPDEFYMAGSALNITLAPDTPGPPMVGLATVEEGRFVDSQWLSRAQSGGRRHRPGQQYHAPRRSERRHPPGDRVSLPVNGRKTVTTFPEI